ncbi:MAG: class I SAM-dependent methyltransferase [Chloroflexia bacterium]|nr:class I SAM-dependent methyltransferase [Chloroflexia bacterium]
MTKGQSKQSAVSPPVSPSPDAGMTLDTSNFRKHTSGNPLQRRLIDRFHRRVTAQIADLAPQSLLDAGCGEGFVAGLLLRQRQGLALTAFDFNPDAVRLAQARNPSGAFLTATIFDLPFAANAFDVVCCFEVLEHLREPAGALRELVRVARRAVVLSVPREPLFSWANTARGKNLDVRPRGSDPDHRQFWSRDTFAAFVADQLEVTTLTSSFPWTICVGHKRGTVSGN